MLFRSWLYVTFDRCNNFAIERRCEKRTRRGKKHNFFVERDANQFEKSFHLHQLNRFSIQPWNIAETGLRYKSGYATKWSQFVTVDSTASQPPQYRSLNEYSQYQHRWHSKLDKKKKKYIYIYNAIQYIQKYIYNTCKRERRKIDWTNWVESNESERNARTFVIHPSQVQPWIWNVRVHEYIGGAKNFAKLAFVNYPGSFNRGEGMKRGKRVAWNLLRDLFERGGETRSNNSYHRQRAGVACQKQLRMHLRNLNRDVCPPGRAAWLLQIEEFAESRTNFNYLPPPPPLRPIMEDLNQTGRTINPNENAFKRTRN